MIWYTDISSTDDRHAADSRPLGSDRYVDRVITASIDRNSMECLRKVGFYSPTIDRMSIDRSIECQPHSIDTSVECRSLVSIDTRPRVPLVHMILLLNLNLPEDDKKKIDKCLEALESYFKPSRNLVYERYVFNTCVQQSEESVQSYFTRLRKLAASSEYTNR